VSPSPSPRAASPAPADPLPVTTTHTAAAASSRRFALKLQETEPTELKPVFVEGDVSYVYLQHNNIYLVALCRRNSNVTAVFVFLERLVEIMREYFGTLEEESIRDNFVLIYELLDEVMVRAAQAGRRGR
jgi:hypothetical protein